MVGMGFMIRLILILVFISGCGNLPIAYLQNFSSVNDVIFGFPEYEITNEIYDSYENSFMKIRFAISATSIIHHVPEGVPRVCLSPRQAWRRPMT